MLFTAFLLIGMLAIVVLKNRPVLVEQYVPLRIDDRETIRKRRRY